MTISPIQKCELTGLTVATQTPNSYASCPRHTTNVGKYDKHLSMDASSSVDNADNNYPHSYNDGPPKEMTESNGNNDRLKALAGLAGNILEWYDFSVFGSLGDVIGDVFFPPQKGHAAIVESFAVFGGAFFMRPVGGIVMGHIGDKYGPKRALEVSIFLMAIPTFAMGCLPTYDLIGWPCIVLLTLVRLFQGLSVGGQMMSSLVFTIESSPKGQWGLYGSYVMASSSFGTLLGSLVGYALRLWLDHDALRAWGWRIPFLAGILVSFSGVYLRLYCEDDEHHGAVPVDSKSKAPLQVALERKNHRSLLASCLVPLIWSSGYYLIFIWMPVFMSDLIEPPVPQAYAVNSASLFISNILFFPVAGHISDMYGRIRLMIIGGIALLLYSPVAINIIGQYSSHPIIALLAQTTLGMALSLWGSPMLAWLVETFEPEARLTSVSIGYNVAMAIGASTGPTLATVIVDKWGATSSGYLLTFFAFASLFGLAIAPRRSTASVHMDHAL